MKQPLDVWSCLEPRQKNDSDVCYVSKMTKSSCLIMYRNATSFHTSYRSSTSGPPYEVRGPIWFLCKQHINKKQNASCLKIIVRPTHVVSALVSMSL